MWVRLQVMVSARQGDCEVFFNVSDSDIIYSIYVYFYILHDVHKRALREDIRSRHISTILSAIYIYIYIKGLMYCSWWLLFILLVELKSSFKSQTQKRLV